MKTGLYTSYKICCSICRYRAAKILKIHVRSSCMIDLRKRYERNPSSKNYELCIN